MDDLHNDSAADSAQETAPEATPETVDAVQDTPASETAANAVDNAFDSVFSDDAPASDAEPAPEASGPERGPDGKFIAKDAAETPEDGTPIVEEAVETPVEEQPVLDNFTTAPDRFSQMGKDAWANAPQEVRAEVHRLANELETGLNEYKQKFEPFKDFASQLEQSGQDFKSVIDHYTGIESKLKADPIGGLEQICNNMGFALNDVVAHLSGQTPDQSQQKQDATVRELRSEIATLKQELGGVSDTIKTQQDRAALEQVAEFSKDKPRFDELSNDIALFIQSGRATDLQSAYELAERLNPAPAPVQQPKAEPAAQAAPDQKAQTLKGRKSIKGAPSSGSNPATRKPPSSPADAVDNAFAQIGI